MEKARCCMLADQQAKCEDYSWEERAFAEDTAGLLGGCVWPPRSYTCNFCRREFRSAQALGGHMNVHRRDRARLKQFVTHQNQQQQQPPIKSDISMVWGSKMYETSPICLENLTQTQTYNNQQVSINQTSPITLPRASIVSIHQTIHTPDSNFVSSLVVNHDSNLTYLRLDNNSNKRMCLENKKQHKRTSSSMNLSGSTLVLVDNEDVVHYNIHKKRKRDTSASTDLPKVNNHKGEYQVTKMDIPNNEDIDLELRLGDRPKVQ